MTLSELITHLQGIQQISGNPDIRHMRIELTREGTTVLVLTCGTRSRLTVTTPCATNPRTCQAPGCSNIIQSSRVGVFYCSGACRTAACREAKKSKEQT
jgi:hypothetical protein